MHTIKVAILFSGNGSNMQNLIEVLHNQCLEHIPKDNTQAPLLESKASRIEVALTLCNNPNAYGITRSKALQIPCIVINHRDFATREEFDNAMLKILQEYNIELCLLAGFMRILSAPFTKAIPLINIHPSFLPSHKGAHAIRDSFEARCDGGVSVHWVNEELDGGAIILQERIEVAPDDTLKSFEAKIHALEYTLYPKAVLQAISSLPPRKNTTHSESSTSNPQSPLTTQSPLSSIGKERL